MAHKVGEAYFDIFLKLDQAQVDAVRKQIGDKLNRQVEQANARMVKDNAETNRKLLSDDEKTNTERSKTDTDLTRNRNRNSTTRRTTEEKNISTLRRAENAAYNEDRLHGRQRTNDANTFSRLQSQLSGKFQRDQKNNEGSLHRVATQFRTIGTVARGITLAAGALSGFSLLEDTLGGIIAAGPIAAAGIALIPPAIAAVGVEAVILQGAFKGVGQAIKDGMDPSKAKQFQQDLKNLSPAARSFVLELSKAKGILPNIQQTFFSAPQLQAAAARLKPFFEGIKTNFGKLVKANGDFFGRIFGAAVSKKGTKNINDFLGNFSTFITKIGPSASRLFGSLLNFIDRVSKQFAGPGGNAIAKTFDKISHFIDKINVPSLFKTAGTAFKAFGDVLKNIGGSIGGIIKAFGGTDNLGKVFFKNIGGLFKEINQFVNSKNGQTFLKQLIGTLNALSGLADKTLKDGLVFLSNVFAGLYPAIKPFVKAAGKLIDTILTPAFGKLIGHIAGDFLTLGTNILNTVTPAIQGFINFLVKHPKVAEGLAIGITAIYTALKIGKGVKSLSQGLNDVTTALNFFKNPKKVLLGMGQVAAGEDAIGASGNRAAKGAGAAKTSLVGSAGLYGALILVGAGLADLTGGLLDPKGFKAFNKQLGKIGTDLKNLAEGKSGSFKQLQSDAVGFVNEMASGKLGTAVGVFLQTIPPKFATVAGQIQVMFTHTIPSAITQGGGQIVSAFQGAIAQLKVDARSGVTGIETELSGIKGFLTTTASGYFRKFATTVSSIIGGIRKDIGKWWVGVSGYFSSTIKSFITKTAPGYFTTMKTSIKGIIGGITTNVRTWWGSVSGYFSGTIKSFVTSTVPSWWGTMKTSISRNINGVLGGIKTWWSSVSGFLSGTVQSFVTQTVPGYFKTMSTSIISAFSGLGGQIKSAFSDVASNIQTALSPVPGVINTIISGLNSINPSSGGKSLIGHIGSFLGGLNPFGHAKGGPIAGAGGPQSDSIAAMLSNGEFVVQAKWAKKYRKILELINAGHFAKGGFVGRPGYAFGGPVNSAVFSALNTAGAHKIFGDLGNVLKGASAATDAVSKSYTDMQKNIKTQLDTTAKNQHDWRVKQDTELNLHYKSVHDQTAKLPSIFTKPTQDQFNLNAKNQHDWRVKQETELNAHYKQVYTATAKLPSIFTKPTQKEYDTVDKNTKTLWTGVNRTWTSGQGGVGTTVKKLPSQTTVPIKGTYNQFLDATAKAWNNVGKNTAEGVRHVGSLSSQLPKTAGPGVSGLVKLYSLNIKKVWDGIAKPLKLSSLASVAFSASRALAAAVSAPPSISQFHLATGGPIPTSLGGPQQDNVYLQGTRGHPGVNVSGGEYVLNAKAVREIGMPYIAALNKYGGKAVSGDPSGIHIFDPRRERFAAGGEIKGYALGGSIGKNAAKTGAIPSAAAARVPATLGWLASIANRIPYVLGGNGPNSFDCSSLVGNVWARLTGNPINRRYFVTATEAGWLPAHGFASGGDPSGFTVGLTSPPHHTVGILAGHRFEAAHTGTKMRFDDGAANAMNFSRVYHMIGLSGVGGGIGAFGGAPSFAGMTDAQVKEIRAATLKLIPGSSQFSTMLRDIPNTLVPELKALSDKKAAALNAAAAASFGALGGSFSALGSAAGGGQIAAWIAAASKFANIPANWVPGIETIIRRESGGNPNAINRTDSNARAGHPSQGLMQTIPSTFNTYCPPALRSRGILDPVANIAAAVNYIHARYGSIFNVQQANPNLPPKGYRKGTNGARRGWAMVGENGPEMEWFEGGETVVPHHLLSTPLSQLTGFASGTVTKKTTTTIPKSLMDLIHAISVNFTKGSSAIQSSADALVKAIDGNTLARKRKGSIDRTIQQSAAALKKLADQLGISNATVAARGATQDSIKTSLLGFGDITAIPFTAGRGAAGQFIAGLKSAKGRQNRYTAAIKKAAKLGLSPDNIAALTASADGESIIESLALASPGELRQINKLTGDVSTAATTQSAAATTAGFTSAVKLNSAETKKLTAQMKKLAGALETKVAKQIWVHKAAGGFVPRVPGIIGDNVPILATPGEYVSPVGHKVCCDSPTDIDVSVYVDGEKERARAVVKENNRSIIQGFSRR